MNPELGKRKQFTSWPYRMKSPDCVFQNYRGLSALDPYWSRIIITVFFHCRPVTTVMGFINKCYNSELSTLTRRLTRPPRTSLLLLTEVVQLMEKVLRTLWLQCCSFQSIWFVWMRLNMQCWPVAASVRESPPFSLSFFIHFMNGK